MSIPSRTSKAEVVTDFRRSQILDAAREAFARQGLAGTTVDGIARLAGVAKGTVYLYYRSKDEILRQILDDDIAELRESSVPPISGDRPIEDRLIGFLLAVLSFFDRRRDFFEHAHFEMAPETRRKALLRLETVSRAQLDAWREALIRAKADRAIGDVDVDAAAMTVVALASGLAKQRLRGWRSSPVESVAAQAGRTLWKGLAAQ